MKRDVKHSLFTYLLVGYSWIESKFGFSDKLHFISESETTFGFGECCLDPV